MKSALPVLTNEPTDEQVDAWVELANLVKDERASVNACVR
jgi:hypothetical protein